MRHGSGGTGLGPEVFESPVKPAPAQSDDGVGATDSPEHAGLLEAYPRDGLGYTLRFQGRLFQISRADVRPGLRGGRVRVEARFDGTVHARFQDVYASIVERQPRPKQAPAPWFVETVERAPTQGGPDGK